MGRKRYIMTLTATALREALLNNFNGGRLSADELGNKADYNELTDLYRNALDALTEWASKDYIHATTRAETDACFAAATAILNLFKTDENRIIIDEMSMRSLRDMAVKPRKQYSPAFIKARKAENDAHKTANDRYADLRALGAPAKEEDESISDYVARVKESGINVIGGTKDVPLNMLEMFENAVKMYAVKHEDTEAVKKAGRWVWKRPVAVSLNEFAELVETYISDCLENNYNLKSSATVRAERAAERAAKKNA